MVFERPAPQLNPTLQLYSVGFNIICITFWGYTIIIEAILLIHARGRVIGGAGVVCESFDNTGKK